MTGSPRPSNYGRAAEVSHLVAYVWERRHRLRTTSLGEGYTTRSRRARAVWIARRRLTALRVLVVSASIAGRDSHPAEGLHVLRGLPSLSGPPSITSM